ncbi:MAG: HYR domain-containing protein, partial [Lentimicrobiaceae bacterium]|nr:HYR domain-containing protein [Lentimicrobiaceae bacterium]
VQDTEAPAFTFVPADVTVECNAVPAVGIPTATDNCDSDVTITYNGETRTDGSCEDTYTLIRTWTATDNCGNTTNASQTISVQDTEAPAFTFVPADVTVECNAVPAVGIPTATDNCDSDVTITYNGETRTDGSCEDTYTLIRTWTATDNCGNTTNASQTISVQDTEAPAFTTIPADLTVECDGSGNADELTNWLANVAATDICGEVTITNNFDGLSNGCGATGTTTVTWTATDDCGNATTTSATFTIVDTEAPVIVCPQNITINVEANMCGASVQVATPSVIENCSNVTLVNSFNGTANASGFYPVGNTTVTWTATDDCGFSTSCTMTITVIDNEAPHIICPQHITVNNDPGACETYVSVPAPIVNDNCQIRTIINTHTQTDNASGIYPVGTTVVWWTVTDMSGNSSSCFMNVTVVDTEAPVIICPENITVNTDAGVCEALVNVPQPEVSDNCGVVSITNNFNGKTDASGVYPVGTTTIEWLVADANGLTSTCSMTVTVVDNELPTIICPENISVNNDLSICGALVDIPEPEMEDNCGIQSITNNYNGSNHASAIYPVGITEVTWTVTDIHGNSSSCTMTVTVTDNEAPVIECPENIVVSTDAGVCEAMVNVPQPEVTDNCEVETIVNSFNGTENASGIYAVGTTIITWTATDINGITSTCEMSVTVIDTEAPVIACPDNVIALADATCSAMVEIPQPVATDNCGIETISNSYNNTPNASGIYPVGITTIIWTVNDIHGNVTTCSMTVTVNAAPIAMDDYDTTQMNVPVSLAVLMNDTDCDENINKETLTVVTAPENGFTMVDTQTGAVLYTPNADFFGNDTFGYSICNASGLCSEAIVYIHVQRGEIIEDIYLIAKNDMDTTLVNLPRVIVNMQNDFIPEGIQAGISILENPLHGQLTLHADYTVTYTPDIDYIGTDTFTYVLFDEEGIAIADTAISTIVIVADNSRVPVVIYNVITPNGDGYNDKWIIDGIEEYPDNEVMIFNRWNDEVARYNNYNNTTRVWSGENQKNNKILPSATYYYVVKLRSENKIFTGWVIIHGN